MPPSSPKGSHWRGSDRLALVAAVVVAALVGAAGGASTITLEPGHRWGWEEFYPVEHDRSGASFRWSRPRALVHFRGVDRRDGVRVELELRSWRPASAPPPELRIEVDRKIIWRRPAPVDWQTIRLGTGPNDENHLDLVIDVTPFRPADFVGGSADERALGVQARRVRLLTGSGPSAWAMSLVAVAAAAFLFLALVRVEGAIRLCWAIASALGALWIGLAWRRPYVLDASAPWMVPGLRLLLLAVVITPLLLAPSWMATSRRYPRALGVLAVAASIFTVHSAALTNGFFWDDFDFARPIGFSEWLYTFYGTWNWTGIGSDFYRPLVVTLFQLDYRVYGYRAAGYHLTNLLLHVLNASLLMRLLSRWAGPRWALAGAVFFGLHPLTATGVAWISQRTDVLCASLYLLALLAAWRYLKHRRRRALAGSTVSYAGALLAKEMAVSFPAVVLWVGLISNRLRRAGRFVLSLLVVSGIYLAAWLFVFPFKLAQGNLIANLRDVPFNYQVKSVLRLLALAFTPVYYPSHDYGYLERESILYLVTGAALFLGTGALLWRWGRRAEKLGYLFGAGVLLLSVIPLYNFRHPDFIRLGYIPATGAAFALTAAVSWLARRVGRFVAAAVLLLSLWVSLPAVREVLVYWGPGGGIVEVVNRDRVADSDWLNRIGPERRAIFESQIRARKAEREHVPELLARGFP